MDANIATQQRFYRRGLLLGLTLADIVVLLLFGLLLLAQEEAALLKPHKEELQAPEPAATLAQAPHAQQGPLDACPTSPVPPLAEAPPPSVSPTTGVNGFGDEFRTLRPAEPEAVSDQPSAPQVVALKENDPATTLERRAVPPAPRADRASGGARGAPGGQPSGAPSVAASSPAAAAAPGPPSTAAGSPAPGAAGSLGGASSSEPGGAPSETAGSLAAAPAPGPPSTAGGAPAPGAAASPGGGQQGRPRGPAGWDAQCGGRLSGAWDPW